MTNTHKTLIITFIYCFFITLTYLAYKSDRRSATLEGQRRHLNLCCANKYRDQTTCCSELAKFDSIYSDQLIKNMSK